MLNDDQQNGQELLPKKIRTTGFWCSLGISAFIIAYIVGFAVGCVNVAPKDLGLISILLFSLASLLFFWVPWHSLGLSLKKFGPLEFDRKLEGQSVEHIENFSALEDKIEKLEKLLLSEGSENKHNSNVVSLTEAEYKNLIIRFLMDFNEQPFSPLRIESWGAKQEGYKELGGQSDFLRRMLRKLVSEKMLETAISKKGNTLYKIRF